MTPRSTLLSASAKASETKRIGIDRAMPALWWQRQVRSIDPQLLSVPPVLSERRRRRDLVCVLLANQRLDGVTEAAVVELSPVFRLVSHVASLHRRDDEAD